MSKKGKFIVIEGTDGSGKTVQSQRLIKRLKKNNFSIKSLDFPRYQEPSSYFVKQYLNGNYGSWKEVSGYRASLFYALDRFAASDEIKKWKEKGEIIISNRYVVSNLAHQGLKIRNKSERKNFYQWVENLEYHVLSLPRPDLNIFLHVPAEIAFDLVGEKKKREYLGNKKRDIHERDINYLKKAEKIFCEVVDLFPKRFKKVECIKKGKILSMDEIEEKVWRIVKKRLRK